MPFLLGIRIVSLLVLSLILAAILIILLYDLNDKLNYIFKKN